MKKPASCLLLMALILLLCGSVLAQTTWTDGSTANSNWDNAANWSDAVPDLETNAAIPYISGGSGPYILTGMTANVLRFNGPGEGSSDQQAKLFLQGGNINATAIRVGFDNGTKGLIEMTDGEIIVENRFHVGFNSEGIFHISGGYVQAINGGLRIGTNQNGVGQVILDDDDGEIVINQLFVGQDGNGYLEMNAGTIKTDNVDIPAGSGSGLLQLNGGTLETDSLTIKEGHRMDIAGGELILSGNHVDDIEQMLSDGRITIYDGRGYGTAEYDGNATTIQYEEHLLIAHNPYPAYGAVLDVKAGLPLTLSWSPGDTVQEHVLYIGTSAQAVAAADEHSDEYVDTLDAEQLTYDFPYPIEMGDRFYWRVDQADSDSELWNGDVWGFSVNDFVLIDGFTTYDSSGDLAGVWQPQANTSVELQEPGSGNHLYTFHQKEECMKLEFDNTASPHYSEVIRTYSQPQNWADYGIRSLSMAYRGDPDVDLVYVGLSDGDNSDYVIIEGPDKLSQPLWSALDFDLGQFSVDLENIIELTIGLESPASGGSGEVYFDNIKLHTYRCMPSYTRVSQRIDCRVDFYELQKFAFDWLMQSYTINAAEPDDDFLRAYYDFNEGSGDILTDLSVNGNDATIDEQGSENWISEGANGSGYCLYLDGSFGVSIPDTVLADVDETFTISIWVNSGEFGLNADSVEFRTENIGHSDDHYRDIARWQAEDADELQNQWHHFAFVKDGTEMDIYKNGRLIVRNREAGLPIQTPAQTLRLGVADDDNLEPFVGKVDHLHIYSYALNHSEILYLFSGDLSQFYQPLYPVLSKSDLSGEDIVNLKDFSILADFWMQKELWP